MEEDGFTVHLISNVSPDTFPNNNPNSFSTLLANEIDLSKDTWEVGVRQIMYPTRVATVGADDKLHFYKYQEYYRNLLPTPPRGSVDIKQVGGATIDFNIQKAISGQSTQAFEAGNDNYVQNILSAVNQSKWSRKGILSLTYKKESKKFILNIFHEDICFALDQELATYLGFNRRCYTKGTYWAWSAFDNTKTPPGKVKCYLFDLQVLEKETHLLLMTYDEANKRQFYEKTIPYKFNDNLPDEWFTEPKFSIGVYPNEGMIKISEKRAIPKKFKQYATPVIFYHFDEESTKEFKLDDLYRALPFTKNDINKMTPIKGTNSKVKSVRVTLYFTSIRQINYDLQETPFQSVKIGSVKELKKPQDLVPILNQHSKEYKYSFSYNIHLKRFELQNGNTYGIEMSKSLKSILGYESFEDKVIQPSVFVRARQFPILNRGITSLYTYTNIIEPVYVGDVLAPLLLTCPFKRGNKEDQVYQQEFLNPSYHVINRNKVSQIDIAIFDDSGSPIPFIYGKTRITLHFKRH